MHGTIIFASPSSAIKAGAMIPTDRADMLSVSHFKFSARRSPFMKTNFGRPVTELQTEVEAVAEVEAEAEVGVEE